jgi:hypothetical protein
LAAGSDEHVYDCAFCGEENSLLIDLSGPMGPAVQERAPPGSRR